MSFSYKKIQAISNRIITQFKQGDIKLVQISNGSGTPDNPGAPVETQYVLSAVTSKASIEYVKNGLALATDIMVNSEVLEGVVPTLKDFIEIDGSRYKIVSDLSVPVAGDKVVWKFIVRSGG